MAGAAAAAAAPGPAAEAPVIDARRGDLFLTLPCRGETVVDVVVAHPPADSYCRHAAEAEAWTAQTVEDAKTRSYADDARLNRFAFVPFGVETFGRLGKGAMRLLNAFADAAEGNAIVSRSEFMANAMTVLGVALAVGNGKLCEEATSRRIAGSFGRVMQGYQVAGADME